MSDNYPLGADEDPNAPWNKSDKFCKYCDYELILQLAEELCSGSDNCEDLNNMVSKLFNESSLCPYCVEEQIANLREDN